MAQGRWCDTHGVFTVGQWHWGDGVICMVFLLQANGTEEMKTQVGEEEEDDMKEAQEETETVEEQEQSKPFQSVN